MLKKTYRLRLLLLGILSLLVFGVLEIRLYYLQIIRHEAYATRAQHQQNKSITLTPRRGDILDRNGLVLATSHLADTIFLDTRKLTRPPDPKMLRELAELLHKPEEAVVTFFAKKPRRQALYRKASDEISQGLTVLEEHYQIPPGVFIFEKNSKREYPNRSLASHVVGYTKIDDNGDNIGQEGVERSYDKYLKGAYSKQQIPVTSGQKNLAPIDDEALASTLGNNVILTIDQQLQNVTEKALARRVGETQALGGVAIVMEVHSGEILAMASCPDFDLSDFARADPIMRKNRVLTDPLEIGSVMKIITTTLLLDQGLVQPDEPIDCQGGRGFVDGRRMTDSHHVGVVPFRMAFAESSNIGLATVGLRLEPNTYYDGLARFGLGQKSGIDLPGEGIGTLHPVEKWSRLSRTSLPIGYETSLTGIEVIAALGAVGNGGWRMQPHIVREIRTPKGQLIHRNEPKQVEKVASPETCRTVWELMEGVVREGTGKKAQIAGFRIGGKTGTTVKSRPGETPKRYYASFAGLMPITKPRLVFYIYIDEPRGATFYGGDVAAPVFQQIAISASHILGIAPDDPVAFEQAQKAIERNMAIANGTAPTTDTTETSATAMLDSGEVAMTVTADSPTTVTTDGKPRMPSFKGMTAIEVWDRLAKIGIQGKVLGSGVVVSQEPPVGAPLPASGQVASLILAYPSQITKTVGVQTPIRAK